MGSVVKDLMKRSNMKIRLETARKSVFVIILFFVYEGALLAAEPFRIQGNLSLYRLEPRQVYLVENDIEAPIDKSIELPEGTIFLFLDDKKLIINGGFIAHGSDSAPIVFTSVNDTAYHQNRDSTPALPYSWAGIKITEKASNVLLRNAIIKYADTPLTSRGPDVRLENVRRANTKIDGFLLNDQKHTLKPNQPFSFPPILPPVPVAAKIDSLKKGPDTLLVSIPGPKKKPVFWKKLSVRSSLGGAGAVALGIGALYFIKAADKQDRYLAEKYITDHQDNYSYEQVKQAYTAGNAYAAEHNNATAAGKISTIIGGLLLSGFSLTFIF